ncbi:hypothetical protein D3C86_2240650 [compost metagenome]
MNPLMANGDFLRAGFWLSPTYTSPFRPNILKYFFFEADGHFVTIRYNGTLD